MLHSWLVWVICHSMLNILQLNRSEVVEKKQNKTFFYNCKIIPPVQDFASWRQRGGGFGGQRGVLFYKYYLIYYLECFLLGKLW